MDKGRFISEDLQLLSYFPAVTRALWQKGWHRILMAGGVANSCHRRGLRNNRAPVWRSLSIYVWSIY